MLAAGLIALVALPTDTFKDVTQELIALFGLLMAGVLPTMVLTASVLRPSNLSVKRLLHYRDALRTQMLVWIGLFLASFVSSIFVIIGKIVNWSIEFKTPEIGEILNSYNFDAIRIINALIVIGLALVLTRIISVGNGVLSLLGLSAELAIGEAKARDELKFADVEAAVREMSEREEFGKYVDLKH